MRERVVSVRFAPNEYERLRALLVAAPVRDERGRTLRSLAHWCRVALTQSVLTDDLRPGMPSVPIDGVDRIASACRSLNTRAYETNGLHRVVAGSLDALDGVTRVAAEQLPKTSETATARDELRSKLVNIRVHSDDHQLWAWAAREVHFSRVSAWAWDVLVGLSGFVHNRPATMSVVEVRRQLAGAINNAAQLQAVAEETDLDLRDEIETRAIELIALMGQWNNLGRSR